MQRPYRIASALVCFRVATLALTASSFLNYVKASQKPAEQYPLQNYLTAIAQGQWAARDEQLAAIKTSADVAARADFVRKEFLRALGGLPNVATPLHARVTGTLVRDGYRVEKLVFESLPGSFVTANVYVPTTGRGPFPAILGAQGHSTEGKAFPTYQIAFINLALRGNLVLAFDPPGQGERFEQRDAAGQMQLLGHFSPGLQCMLTGGNIVRYFMWDAMRAVDYLVTRADVDPKRIGVCGNSGGGTQSAFLSVLEPRISVAAPSCYWTSWPALWAKSGPQDPEQVLHHTIKRGIDYSDVLFAFAPKPMIMLTATKDSFPIAGAHAAHAEGKPAYALFGAPANLEFFEYNDPHGWSQPRREATYAWFDRWFHGKSGPVSEVAVKTESIETLQCTATGQVVTALSGKTIQALSLELAEKLYARRRLAAVSNPEEARAVIAARLEIGATRVQPETAERLSSEQDGDKISRLAIMPEPGISLEIELIAKAATSRSPRPVLIFLPDTASSNPAEWKRELQVWIDAGYTVAIAQLRGLLPPDKPAEFGYTTRYRTAMRAITVGKTVAGMRVQDLLAVYDCLAARSDVNGQRISVMGRGQMGAVALFAAALEPGFRKIVADRALVSFQDLARATAIPVLWADSILPGVFFDFDLPDIARLAGPGRIVLVNPVSVAEPQEAARLARSQYGLNAKVIADPGALLRELE